VSFFLLNLLRRASHHSKVILNVKYFIQQSYFTSINSAHLRHNASRGNRIASVAATQDSDNSLSNSIDARGAFLIPGLWDMHVHVHDVNELPLYIANGAIEPGKIANLVLLRADPLADIHNSTQIQAVWLQGKYFDQAALAHLLEAAKQ
jgi:imidazolonepropionase-like amidohydrolase